MVKQLLNGADWTLSGWNRYQWYFERSMELGKSFVPMVQPLSATVPGSVQMDMLRAGRIDDWNYGDNFRKIEWLERREWVYSKTFTALNKADKIILHLDGVDYSGYVFINGEQIYYFEGMHIPHTVDVTKLILPNAENEIKIVFLQMPEIDGQVGYTSKVSILKSRYNYGWDWMPRLVNIGIFRDVWLEYADKISVKEYYPKASVQEQKGIVNAKAVIDTFENATLCAHLTLKKQGNIIAKSEQTFEALRGENTLDLSLSANDIELWFPNGYGEQPLYNAELEIFDNCGKLLSQSNAQIGFRTISFTAPPDAVEGCLPYNAVINGKCINIRGINWVPLSPFYGTVTEEQYEFYLKRFKMLGCTLIRVWGGALQESETFYSLCDQMGLMVWQEFPQSSSGLDNATNETAEYIENLHTVAVEYMKRARNHVSVTYWCGGNELYWGAQQFPCDLTSGNLSMLAEVTKKYMPETLFLPASPSHAENGVKYYPEITDFINTDSHGPWLYEGVDKHYDIIYNQKDTVLFSEIGSPSASRTEKIEQYCTKGSVWPPDNTNSYWTERNAWWVEDGSIKALFGDFEVFEKKLQKFVAAYRFLQFESLRSSVSAVRHEGDKKSGIIVWMGNEPFANVANTSILEMDGYTKPAYYAVKKGFSRITAGLYYKTPFLRDEHSTTARLYLCSDDNCKLDAVKITVFGESGEVLSTNEWKNINVSQTIELAEINIEVKESISLVRLEINQKTFDEWIFTRGEFPFKSLLIAPNTELECKILNNNSAEIINKGQNIAFFAEVEAYEEDGKPVAWDDGYFCLLPGESRICTTEQTISRVKATYINE